MTDDAWEFQNPTRVVFGPGTIDTIGSIVVGKTLLVTTRGGSRRGLTARIRELVGATMTVHDSVTANPTLRDLDATVARWHGEDIQTLVGLGGGSSIDTAKILSIALTRPRAKVRDLVTRPESASEGNPIRVVAVPTTAGTGSEVTPFATVWDGDLRKKLSISSPRLFPSVALVDPELTESLSWEGTLGPGLDAYTQCFEAIWNRNATPITTGLAEHGIGLVPGALRQLKTKLTSREARSQMSEAALLSGFAISHTRTALAHSISYPLTAHLGLPHGLACGFALPHVLAYNQAADDGRLTRISTVSEVLDLFNELGVADAVRRYVPDPSVIDELLPELLTPARAANNMRPANAHAIREIVTSMQQWLS